MLGMKAVTRRDRSADSVRLAGDVESGVCLGHSRSCKGELREAIGTPQRAPVEPAFGLEVRRLAADSHSVTVSRERRDRRAGALACEQASPGRLDVGAERRHRAEPGDHDPAMQLVRLSGYA